MSALAPGARIGILGAGQLGRMLATSAAELGFDVHVFTPEEDSPAGRVAAKTVTAPYEDEAALRRFAQDTDVVTFEFENVPVTALAACAAHAPVRPGPQSLELTQDRLVEKRFVTGLGLATAPFAEVSSPSDLMSAVAALKTPAILKTRRFGYDGKGQVRIETPAEALKAYAALNGAPAILEGFVAFEREISVIAARGADGAFQPFPVTQNTHEGGILRQSFAPAALDPQTAAAAVAATAAIAEGLAHVGVLAVEFFLEPGGALRVNEIAPRVHNSGHWTQDAGGVSQFTQHIRAVAGWPLTPPSSLSSPVRMVNLIGADATDWRDWAFEPSARLHLYGKRAARDGRKMGHVTIAETQSGKN